tara:strand:+ start:166 stop:798 length:633 start_codon:yes stop_codon:yes gene_type:complete
MKKEKIILVLNGILPKKDKLYKILKGYDKIFCADGAANKVINSNINPNYILGDLDSVNLTIIKNKKYQIINLPNQNFNDFQKILVWLKNKKYKELDVIGIDGKRLDHTIGNFHILIDEVNNFNLTVFTEFGIFYTVIKKRIFNDCNNKYFSIFSKNKINKINSSGLKYELKNKTFKNLQEGTLNIAIKNNVTIKSEENILVYISNKPKKN